MVKVTFYSVQYAKMEREDLMNLTKNQCTDDVTETHSHLPLQLQRS